jgi:hypothetical protein
MERKTLYLMLNLRQIISRKIREIFPVVKPDCPKIREISPATQPDRYKHLEPIQRKISRISYTRCQFIEKFRGSLKIRCSLFNIQYSASPTSFAFFIFDKQIQSSAFLFTLVVMSG